MEKTAAINVLPLSHEHRIQLHLCYVHAISGGLRNKNSSRRRIQLALIMMWYTASMIFLALPSGKLADKIGRKKPAFVSWVLLAFFPTHSIIILFVVFIPIFALYHKKAIPYFLALIQHPLLADYVAGGKIQLLWPLTTQCYGMEIDIQSATNISLEWILFLVFTVILLKSKDITTFFKPYKSNLILSIPTFSVLLPTFLSFPLEVPIWLIPPHLFFVFIFLTSIFIDIRRISASSWKKQTMKLPGLSER